MAAPLPGDRKEGRKIGRLTLPDFLVQSMEEGTHILLEAPLKIRAKRIVSEYINGKLDDAEKMNLPGPSYRLFPAWETTRRKLLALLKRVTTGR